MTSTHDPTLVVLSVVVATIASYTALDLGNRVAATRGIARAAWLTGGAVAMGIGIWSMHFTAMLAFRLPVPIAYDIPLLILSVLVAIAASALALLVIGRKTVRTPALLASGLLMGLAVAGMHYTGMAAVEVQAQLHYHPWLVLLSIVIAVVASIVALRLAIHFRHAMTSRALLGKSASALLMGAAIAGLHYTAMAAAHFSHDQVHDSAAIETLQGAVLATSTLAAVVVIGSLLILGFTLLTIVIDRWRMTSLAQANEELQLEVNERKRAEQALAHSLSLLRATFDAMTEGILSVDLQGRITGYNRQFGAIWQIPEEALASGDDERLLRDAQTRLKDPESFLRKVRELYSQPEVTSQDVLDFKDGRIIERSSLPQRIGEQIVGRVWSFRDITERRRAEVALREANEALEQRVAERTAELAEANEQLVHQAFYDSLTGLPNRALFMDRVKHALKKEARGDRHGFAVLFLDFDRFKVVNDSLGHLVGDALLVALARRLEACLRPGDTVARLGGDEFTILLEDLHRFDDVIAVIERIQDALRQPCDLGRHTIYTSASIGVVCSESGYERAEDLLRDADIAMYRAKAQGKAGYQVFDRAMRERAMAAMEFETELRTAIERGELEVYYQPIVSVESEELIGLEALVRWRHPQHGMVLPAAFIPIAEESGLIVEIDRWVLREACQQIRSWTAQYALPRTPILSVNLSPQQFLRADLADRIRDILQETGFDPKTLKLEITESLLMASSQLTMNLLEQLRALSVQLSIDDFGTGYSSLSYLQRFPTQALKIDRSFINNLTHSSENLELVRTIIAMARNLGMDVVAEGVESEEQLMHLKELRCGYAQGYLFSKPLAAEAVPQLLLQQVTTALEAALMSDSNSDLPNNPVPKTAGGT